MGLLVFLMLAVVAAAVSVIVPDPAVTTYALQQGTPTFQLWTTPITKRIRDTSTTVPTAQSSGLKVFCAREELESFQLVIAPTAVATAVVQFTNFVGLGAGSWLEVAQASFSPVSAWGQGTWQVTDKTTALVSGATISLSSTRPTVLIATVYVPGSTCGRSTYTTTLSLTPAGAGRIDVPVSMYVFDVLLDQTPHLASNGESQPRFTVSGTVYNVTQLDKMYEVYGQHRLSGRSQSWPAGLNWQVSWDGTTKQLKDMDGTTSTQACIWANGCSYRRYVLGLGGTWRGVPYTAPAWAPTAHSEAMSTDGGRPSTFGGIPCNTAGSGWVGAQWNNWMCDSTYEASWGDYQRQLVTWLTANVPNYAQSLHGVYYTVNEPQNWNDYTISAYMCKQTHTRAPGMKVLISREAHPWIYNRADGLSCGYDVWVGHINRVQLYRTWNRQALGEHAFTYFLDTDAGCAPSGAGGLPGIRCSPHLAPYISATGNNGAMNPGATNDGMHYRAIPWVYWATRTEGFLYYKDGGTTLWDDTGMNTAAGYKPPRPRVSATLFREGMEDYEYIFQANCNRNPEVFKRSQVDETVHSIGSLYASFRNGPNAEDEHAQLRVELGKYLEGTRADLPALIIPKMFPFANLFFDFCADPGTNTPFVLNAAQWIPVDFNNNYDPLKGFGFQSKELGLPNWIQPSTVWILQCKDSGFGDAVQRTVCYNNFNQNDQFHVNIAPGDYDVSVGVGFGNGAANPRNGDIEYIEINDVILRNMSCSTVPGTCFGVREYTARVTVKPASTGGMLIMSFGSPYQAGYVALSYLKIVAVGAAQPITSQPTCNRPIAPACVGGTTAATTTVTTAAAATTAATAATTAPAATTVAGGATTTVAAATTTAIAGGTTTPAGGATTTTASAGITTSAAGATTTAVAGGTTTIVAGATTTATGATGTTTTATTAPGSTTVPGSIGRPCVFSNSSVPGSERSILTLREVFSQFDCEQFRNTLAFDMEIAPSDLAFHTAVSGSVILSFSAPIFATNAFSNKVAQGTSSIPNIASVQRASGAIVTPPDNTWWIILVAVLCSVLVVAAVVVLVVCIIKRRRDSKYYSSSRGAGDYHIISETPRPAASSYAAPVASSYVAPVVPSASSPVLLSFLLAADVVDSSDTILPGKRGDLCLLTPEDAAQTSDWAWCRIGTSEGYVPRSFLQRAK